MEIGLPVLLLLFSPYLCSEALADDHGEGAEIVYQWNIVEYEWPNETYKSEEIANGNYIPENSAINGIKLYKGTVYVTVPRLKPGVPSTLNVIIAAPPGSNGSNYILRPFPSWDMQKLGNCEALQRVQSMEIDPNTGHMWVVDTGRHAVNLIFNTEHATFCSCFSSNNFHNAFM